MSKKFNIEQCAIPQVWCGEGKPKKNNDPLVKYTRKGTPHECLKKGFGAGAAIQRKENLPRNSIQQIKYIGDAHEAAFLKVGIATTDQLLKQMKKHTTAEMETILKRVLKNKDKRLDVRAYNCVVVYLYQHGIGAVPACTKIGKAE
jgi:hypothetical protein